MMDISRKAVDLILEFEGFDRPDRWPGAASGITLPIGYDLGYKSLHEFKTDWGSYLSRNDLSRLQTALGVRGEAAKKIAHHYAGIDIDPDDARAVFEEATLPKYIRAAERAFPGIEALPEDARGALVSLVFNRGTSMKGSTRREMREVRDAVAVGDLQQIADSIRSMKRIWEGRGLAGLLRRRDAEADLVEASIPPPKPPRHYEAPCAEGGLK